MDHEIATLPPKTFIENTPEFTRVKQIAMARHPLTEKQIEQGQGVAQAVKRCHRQRGAGA